MEVQHENKLKYMGLSNTNSASYSKINFENLAFKQDISVVSWNTSFYFNQNNVFECLINILIGPLYNF